MYIKILEFPREYKESGFTTKVSKYSEYVVKLIEDSQEFTIITFDSLNSDISEVENYCNSLGSKINCNVVKVVMKKKIIETWEES